MTHKILITALVASFTISSYAAAGDPVDAVTYGAPNSVEPAAVSQERPKARTPKAKTPKERAIEKRKQTLRPTPAPRRTSYQDKKKQPTVKPNSLRNNSREQNNAMKAQRQEKLMSYSKLRKKATAQIPGKVVGQELVRTNQNGWVYQLRIMQSNGRVKYAVVDAKTGRVLSVR